MLEKNKIYNEDCLIGMKQITDKSVDCIITDLPYGTTACNWDSVIPFDKMWEQYKRIIKDKRAIILFGQEPFSSRLRMSNIEMYRYDWIWQKEKPSNFQLMNYQPGRVQENIMVFSTGKACYTSNGNSIVYYPQMEEQEKIRKGNVKIYGDASKNILNEYKNGEKDNYREYDKKHPISILRFNNETHKVHPTQKPITLLEYLIRTYTSEGELVLDSCCGSGSTCLAAKNLGRDFVGFELNKEYYDIAVERCGLNPSAWVYDF